MSKVTGTEIGSVSVVKQQKIVLKNCCTPMKNTSEVVENTSDVFFTRSDVVSTRSDVVSTRSDLVIVLPNIKFLDSKVVKNNPLSLIQVAIADYLIV